jgi:Flp pilus assembly protein TadG
MIASNDHGRAGAASRSRRRPARNHRIGDRGSLTLLLAALMVALLAVVGLVIDGGRKLAESAGAYAIAQEAARAGAGIVDTSAAYQSGRYLVDPGLALTAARAYLARAGYRGSVSLDGANRIRVSVTVTEPTVVLSLLGIDTMTARATAVASLVTGVTGPGS